MTYSIPTRKAIKVWKIDYTKELLTLKRQVVRWRTSKKLGEKKKHFWIVNHQNRSSLAATSFAHFEDPFDRECSWHELRGAFYPPKLMLNIFFWGPRSTRHLRVTESESQVLLVTTLAVRQPHTNRVALSLSPSPIEGRGTGLAICCFLLRMMALSSQNLLILALNWHIWIWRI